MRRLVASSTARATASASCCGPHDRRSRHELLRRRHHEHDGDDRDVVRVDAQDLRAVDVDALGGGLELTQRVDGRGRDEPVPGGGGDRALREADRLFVVAARA